MSNDIKVGVTITADAKSATPVIKDLATEEQKIAKNAQAAAAQLANQNKQLQNTTLTAGQMTQALRQVPMQFTDIVTSLGSGQKPLQVLLQQGGQLKDSFGGVGAAVRALGGYIVGLINPTTVAVTAAVGLATAYFNGQKQSQILKDTVVLTGNAAGKTASQLESMVQASGGLTGKYSESRQALVELVGSGKLAGEQIDIALRGVMDTSRATGKEVSDVVEMFVKLADDPVRAIKAYNLQYNFLTADIYKQIVALQEQGKTQDAATLAIETFSKAMKERSTQVVENAGYIEKAWDGVKSAIDGAWKSLLSIGRDNTLDEQIASFEKQIETAKRMKGAAGVASVNERNLPSLEAELTRLKQLKQESEAAAQAKDKLNQKNKDEINAVDALNKYLASNKGLTASGILSKQLADENAAFQAAVVGLDKNSAKYREIYQRHITELKNIKKNAKDKNDKDQEDEIYKEAQRLAQQNQNLIATFQQAVAPAQSMSDKLQEQLDKYVALDPAVRKYLQGLADQVKATEEAKIAQEALNEAIARNNEVMEGIQAGEDADKAVYDNNAKVYQDILRETEDMNIAMIESDRERARAQIEIEHQRRVERIGSMEGEQDQIDAILEAEEERYRTAVKNIGNETKKTKSISQELGLTMKSSFEEAVLSGKKLSDVLQGIFEDITKILLRKNVTEPLADAVGNFDWGSIFGGDSSGTIFNAKGGIYPAGDISQYSNSIVNKPTFFTGKPLNMFAAGGNVMGEAGFETIMPTKRMSNGNMGVQVSGMGANITVNLIETSDKNKQGTVETSNSGMTVDAYVESIVDRKLQNDLRKGTGFPRALENTYNLSRMAK